MRPEIVHDIAFIWQPRQIDALDLVRLAPEARHHGVGVSMTHLIVVGHDDHVAAFEVLRVFLAPLPGPAVICRGDQPGLDQHVGALLALDNEDRRALVLDDAEQVVRQRRDALDVVQVAALAVGLAQAEALRIHPQRLIRLGSVCVVIRVNALDVLLRL